MKKTILTVLIFSIWILIFVSLDVFQITIALYVMPGILTAIAALSGIREILRSKKEVKLCLIDPLRDGSGGVSRRWPKKALE